MGLIPKRNCISDVNTCIKNSYQRETTLPVWPSYVYKEKPFQCGPRTKKNLIIADLVPERNLNPEEKPYKCEHYTNEALSKALSVWPLIPKRNIISVDLILKRNPISVCWVINDNWNVTICYCCIIVILLRYTLFHDIEKKTHTSTKEKPYQWENSICCQRETQERNLTTDDASMIYILHVILTYYLELIPRSHTKEKEGQNQC